MEYQLLIFIIKNLKNTYNSKKNVEEMGNLFVNENLGRVAIRDEIENLDNYEKSCTYHHMGGTRIEKIKKISCRYDLKLH